MEDLVQADIFFFIASGAVIILVVIFLAVAYYVIAILREVRGLSRRARFRGNQIMDDLRLISRDLRERRGMKLVRTLFRWFYYRRR